MTEATVAHPFSQEAFEAFLAARTEPDWLTQLRREAWEDFQQMDWPGRRDEEWIRTDIRRFKLDSFTMPSKDAEVAESEALLAEGVELGGWSAPGCRFDLDDKWSAKGVVFGSLDELVNETW